MRLSLIDGDLIAFRCAATCNNEEFKIAVYRMEDMLDRIFLAIKAREYKMYLTGANNFRKKLDPMYKANRKDKIPPIHLQACREYLITKWKAKVTDGIEADDALGIEQCLQLKNENVSTVICSIDKDLLQIPGKHYNFLHDEKKTITPIEGFRHFYKQLLIGDTSDNIQGVRGIGKVGAGKHLDHLETEQEMFECVKNLYSDEQRLILNCNLLWIQQKENEIWIDRSKHLHEATVSESKGQEPTEVGEGQDTELDRSDPRRC
jgi:5'-3' exonuclease